MFLYMVRHGETDWNCNLKIQGQTDNPLNAEGKHQAGELRPFFAKLAFCDIYSSPLIRARQTAELSCPDKISEIIYDDRLKEISYGADEGQSLLLIDSDPALRLHNFFYNSANYIPPNGGESFPELKKRCADFLNEIRSRYSDSERVLISTHGA